MDGVNIYTYICCGMMPLVSGPLPLLVNDFFRRDHIFFFIIFITFSPLMMLEEVLHVLQDSSD